MDQYPNTAVAFCNLKSAALYFDYVIPVNLCLEMIDPSNRDQILTEMTPARLSPPPALCQNQEFLDQLIDVNEKMLEVVRKAAAEKYHMDGWFSQEELDSIDRVAAENYWNFVNKFKLNNCPLILDGNVRQADLMDDDVTARSPILTLAGLEVIDISKASWRQILEFREDLTARLKLRRFRLFAYTNYSGKPRSYIEDDLLTRIEDYQGALKQWGFETVQGALNAVLTSKLSMVTVGGSILSALLGTPAHAEKALAVGVIAQLGHIAVEFTRQRLSFQKLMRENPVSFISYAQSLLSEGRDNENEKSQ